MDCPPMGSGLYWAADAPSGGADDTKGELMRRSKVGLAMFLTSAVMLSACGSSSSGDGSGGSSGSGGVKGSGGVTGTGGHASGGATGTGGVVGSGGVNGSGGVLGSGGVSSTGGVHGTGGTLGSGGVSGSGGSGSGGSGSGGSAAGGTAGAGTGGTAGAGNSGGAGGGSTGSAGAAGGSTGVAGSGAGGNAGGAGGTSAAGGGGGHAAGGAGGATDPVLARGEYLVKSVLGCVGCHTPSGGASLSGTDCFVNSNGSCLSSANLTNDDTGIKNFTKQQIEDAFRLGKYPNDPTKYLFANMPYYQFTNVSDSDADAIVAYLRTVPAVSHTVQANTAPYNTRPTSPENAAVSPNALPAASPVAGPTNGKYLATLVCVTCHTVDLANSTPKLIDASKAFQGGRIVTTTVNNATKMLQSANLTPDGTGLMSWNVTQVANAITTAKDKNSVALCGMRALANMTPSDATDIASYLLSIPPVANTITMTCQ